MKRTPLKTKVRLKSMSIKKIRQINDEEDTRKALCRRAGGNPVTVLKNVYRDGKMFILRTVKCYGGTCECGCGQSNSAQLLEPHEQAHRSLGGELSLKNTKMVVRECHIRLQKSSPLWTPKG